MLRNTLGCVLVISGVVREEINAVAAIVGSILVVAGNHFD